MPFNLTEIGFFNRFLAFTHYTHTHTHSHHVYYTLSKMLNYWQNKKKTFFFHFHLNVYSSADIYSAPVHLFQFTNVNWNYHLFLISFARVPYCFFYFTNHFILILLLFPPSHTKRIKIDFYLSILLTQCMESIKYFKCPTNSTHNTQSPPSQPPPLLLREKERKRIQLQNKLLALFKTSNK